MLVPQDEEVKLEVEVVAIVVLQVDGPLIVLALVVLFDASAYDASLRLVQQILVLMAYSSKFRGVGTLVLNCIVFKIFLMCGQVCSTQ